MFKKSLILAAAVTAATFASVAPSTAQNAALAASCSAGSASCIAAVRALVGPNPTAARIAEVVASLSGLDLDDAVLAASVSAAITDVATLSPDPVQQVALNNIAEAVSQGGETATAAIDQVSASAI